jgi:hypothetical protein
MVVGSNHRGTRCGPKSLDRSFDAQLTCNVCQASFLIEGGHRLSFAPADARSECSLGSNKTPKKTVPTNAAINYQCDSSAGIRVQNPNNNPVDVETFSVRIGVYYDVNLLATRWHREFRSEIFTYIRRPNGNFWFKGDLVPYSNSR